MVKITDAQGRALVQVARGESHMSIHGTTLDNLRRKGLIAWDAEAQRYYLTEAGNELLGL